MFDLLDTYSGYNEPMVTYLTTKSNIRTGEGRMRIRGANKLGDMKKKEHRKMAKKSKRQNRRRK